MGATIPGVLRYHGYRWRHWVDLTPLVRTLSMNMAIGAFMQHVCWSFLQGFVDIRLVCDDVIPSRCTHDQPPACYVLRFRHMRMVSDIDRGGPNDCADRIRRMNPYWYKNPQGRPSSNVSARPYPPYWHNNRGPTLSRQKRPERTSAHNGTELRRLLLGISRNREGV